MTAYEKIRTKEGRVVILKNPIEVELIGTQGVRGIRCDREGQTVFEDKDGQPYREVCVFAMEDIGWRKPMIMSNYYGELVYLETNRP